MINFIRYIYGCNFLKYSQNKNFTLYFILCLTLVWGSGLVVGEIFSIIDPGLDQALMDQMRSENLIATFFFGVVVAPIFETAVLIYCLHLSNQTKFRKFYILISTLIICILHLPRYWELFFIVFLPFYLQAVAYISVREQCSFRNSFLFLVAIHFLCNLVSIILNIYNL